MPPQELSTLLKDLTIPPDFVHYENISDKDMKSSLVAWKRKTSLVLQNLLHVIQSKEGHELPLETKADVLFALAPFLPQSLFGDDEICVQSDHDVEPWITAESQMTAQEIMSSPELSPSKHFVILLLTHNLKPIFSSSPHPLLHTGSGRQLSKPAGGPMAMQDYYEGQLWKQYPGIDKAVLWCVHNIEEDAYESLWHLVIPPIMTFLDDYETRYKLRGVVIVQEMLRHVSGDLLKKTGVDGLLKQSLRASMSHLQSRETPLLIKKAITAYVSLVLLTTSISNGGKPNSGRFDELSSLFGEGIISGIWMYAGDKPDVLKATLDVLPALLYALRIGSVRFFKALIPQLAHILIPLPMINPDRGMQLSAIGVLHALLEVGGPRVEPWKETLLDAVGKCWVGLIEESVAMQANGKEGSSSKDVESVNNVKKELKGLCVKLAQVSPSVNENEFPRFLQADRALFTDLIPGAPDLLMEI